MLVIMEKFKKYIPFVSFWLLGAILLFLSEKFYPMAFKLGSVEVRMPLAVFWASLVWNLIVWFSAPLAKRMGLKIEESPVNMMLFYFLSNFVALWMTARLGPMTGLGVASSLWIASLALVATLTQWGVWSSLEKAKLTK